MKQQYKRKSIFNDKKTQIEKRNSILIWGLGFLMFGIVGSSAAPATKFETGEPAWPVMLGFGLFLVAIGAFLIIFFVRLNKQYKKYQKYLSLINIQNILDIQKVSELVGLPERKVTNDIQDMINSAYIYAYIDFKNKTVILTQPPANPIPIYPPQGCIQPPVQTALPNQKINLNLCSEQELANLPGVGVALAKKAVEIRSQINGFLSVQDFNQRLGLMPHFAVQIDNFAFVTPMNEQSGTPDSKGRVIDI